MATELQDHLGDNMWTRTFPQVIRRRLKRSKGNNNKENCKVMEFKDPVATRENMNYIPEYKPIAILQHSKPSLQQFD